MFCNPRRKLAAKTPVRDHAGSVLFHADPTQAQHLIDSGNVEVGGTRNRIKSLRFRGPDPAHLSGGSTWRPPIGTPHKRETDRNVRGCWTFNRLPDSYRPLFLSVVFDQLVA